MGLMVIATAPIQMTFMGLPVTGTIGRGVRTGDDSNVLGLMDWLHPDQFGSFIIYDMTVARANAMVARAEAQGGVQLTDTANSWLSLVISAAALRAAFTAMGVPINGAGLNVEPPLDDGPPPQ
jgi:hypothetical protein